MRITILTILFILPIYYSCAQSTISGTITDFESNKIEFADVYALVTDSLNIVNATITDSLGKYSLTLFNGEYQLVVRLFGYQADTSVFSINNSNIIHNVSLKPDITIFDDVTVEGKRPKFVREVDRLVFNYNDAVSVVGGTAIDALKVTPSIIVNNSGISMQGKESVRVLINGREQNMSPAQVFDYLQSLDAKTIKNIEVITTPPSNMDAGENIGVININLLSPLHDHWKAYLKGNHNRASYGESSLRGNFAIQKNHLSMSANMSIKRGSWLSLSEQKIRYDNQHVSTVDSLIDHSSRLFGGLKFQYTPRENSIFSGSYSLKIASPSEEIISNSFLTNSLSGSLDSTIQTSTYADKRSDFHSGTLRYDHVFDSLGKSMTLTADIFHLSELNSRNFDSRSIGGTYDNITGTANGKRNILNYSFLSDFYVPIKNISLDFGAKFSSSETHNKLEYSVSNISITEPQNTFMYVENTLAGYIQAKRKLSKKLQAKVGLRFESTQSKGTSEIDSSFTNNYRRLFPTAYLSYKASKNHMLSIEYGSRINRPRFSMLNPFRIYSSPFSYVSGNPFLQPSFLDEIRIHHSYKQLLNTSIFIQKESNSYSLLTEIEEGTINQSTAPYNFLDKQVVGISESLGIDIKDRFSTFISLRASYHKSYSNSSITKSVIEGWNTAISSNNSIYLNNKETITLSVDASYAFPSTFGINQYYQVFVLNIGLRAMFFDKNMTVDLGVSDVFASNKMRWETDINGIYFYNTFRSDNPIFQGSISYRFGQKSLKTPNVNEGNQSEKMRAN